MYVDTDGIGCWYEESMESDNQPLRVRESMRARHFNVNAPTITAAEFDAARDQYLDDVADTPYRSI